MKQLLCAVAATFVLAGFFMPSTSAAHRFHTSLTRMDYNAEEKSVEITIQVFTHDLQDALEKQEKKSINFEKAPKIDEIILKYLSDRFVFKNKAGETKKLNWVGMEIKTDSIWLYVETSMPEGMSQSKLENRLLQEMFEDQVNLVTARFDNKKIDFICKPGDEAREIKRNDDLKIESKLVFRSENVSIVKDSSNSSFLKFTSK